MCGIAGWINLKEDISMERETIEKMTKTLKKRGPDAEGYYCSTHSLLGHRRLIIVDPKGGIQPMIKSLGDATYVLVYNGELYNTEDLRKTLVSEGYTFDGYSDTEVLLTAYMHWGPDCVEYLNGIFAFGVWEEKKQSLFLARDPLGVKPLFYTRKNDSIIFGSELKTLLAHNDVEPIVDSTGLLELFALGPARSLQSGIFKNIYELAPATCLLHDKNNFTIKEYWKLHCEDHNEDITTTSEHVRELFVDAIKRQLVSDVPVCTFLSGGLDSSAISAIVASEYKKQGKILNTFSVDYEDNDLFFQANDFEPNQDKFWACKVSEHIGSKHTNIINKSDELAYSLIDAVKSSDIPGMADIDSSLYLFCREVRKNFTVSLSGECADELFGGYPWYRNIEDINATTFPWSKSIDERKKILSKDLQHLDLEQYVNEKYLDSIKNVPYLDSDSPIDRRMRELFYLNIKWFMVTLLNRKDRMSMGNSLEVRVPFADYRLVQYAFNIPFSIKFCDNREKGILRKALRGILPDEVIERKKSPYPKTHNPAYTKIVVDWMKNIISDPSAPILQIIDKEKLIELIESEGSSFKKPWFGQLMRGPQLIAYLIQLNIWLRQYKVKIEL